MLGGGGNPSAWYDVAGQRTSHDSEGTAAGVAVVRMGNDYVGVSLETDAAAGGHRVVVVHRYRFDLGGRLRAHPPGKLPVALVAAAAGTRRRGDLPGRPAYCHEPRPRRGRRTLDARSPVGRRCVHGGARSGGRGRRQRPGWRSTGGRIVPGAHGPAVEAVVSGPAGRSPVVRCVRGAHGPAVEAVVSGPAGRPRWSDGAWGARSGGRGRRQRPGWGPRWSDGAWGARSGGRGRGFTAAMSARYHVG